MNCPLERRAWRHAPNHPLGVSYKAPLPGIGPDLVQASSERRAYIKCNLVTTCAESHP
jgi:hypothetical protein